MARREAGFASLTIGVIIGIIGFQVYNFQAVCFFTCIRPNETLGLLVMGFGMVLFILGIVLLAIGTKGE